MTNRRPDLLILHLTDLHLKGSLLGRVRGVVTYVSFRTCLEAALSGHGGARALVLTGNLVQDDPKH